MNKRVLVVDNFDSFVYILVQYLGQLGVETAVVRNDAVGDFDNIEADGILISPGPGEPSDAGQTKDVISHFAGKIPILGVCLGHQAIGEVYGGDVVRAPSLMHGKTSIIEHNNEGLFEGFEKPFRATRYHSLVVDKDTLPASLDVTATTDEGLIMGFRHNEHEIEGVQFHPESVLTEHGDKLLGNWVKRL